MHHQRLHHRRHSPPAALLFLVVLPPAHQIIKDIEQPNSNHSNFNNNPFYVRVH